MLVSDLEAKEGLRPYRLSTRYWVPSDKYKVDEAYEIVEEARNRLKHYYNELKERK